MPRNGSIKNWLLFENKLSTSSVSTIEFNIFGLNEGELIKALTKPVFGSKATSAPLLFSKAEIGDLVIFDQLLSKYLYRLLLLEYLKSSLIFL